MDHDQLASDLNLHYFKNEVNSHSVLIRANTVLLLLNYFNHFFIVFVFYCASIYFYNKSTYM